MNLRVKTKNIEIIAGRPLFFDANVLLYLFGPAAASINQSWAIDAYSSVLKYSLIKKSTICIDITVLSEFINRFFRLEHQNHNKRNNRNISFKEYRATAEGLEIAQDIEDVVMGKILKHFSLIGKLFKTAEIKSIHLPNCDFNDVLIIETCKEHACVLVTNDADFVNANVDILTANNKLSKN